MNKYIVGHKNPDTDSILSAIVFAEIFGEGYVATKQGEPNKEALYILNRFRVGVPIDIPVSGERQIILIDHNSKEEGPEGLTPEEVVAIYDHHKLGGPVTADLVEVRIEKVGCTATVAAEIFKERGIEPSEKAASLMIAAIISDTLKLTSPTTTQKDKDVVSSLAQKQNIDIDELAKAMFEAKSDISDVPTEELINKDYKEFNLGDQKVGVGVWETVLPDTVLDRKAEIVNLLLKKKEEEKLDYIYFVVVDILHNTGTFVVSAEREQRLAEAVFGGACQNSLLVCPGVVSRKKQITPPIEKYLAASA